MKMPPKDLYTIFMENAAKRFERLKNSGLLTEEIIQMAMKRFKMTRDIADESIIKDIAILLSEKIIQMAMKRSKMTGDIVDESIIKDIAIHHYDNYTDTELIDSLKNMYDPQQILIPSHTNFIYESRFIRDDVFLVAEVNPITNQQLLIFKQIDPITRRIIFEDRLECIHAVIARIPCEEYERVMEDPELEEEYRKHPSKLKSTDTFLREGEDITSINLRFDEKLFAFMSWVQGIAEAGIDALKLQSDIDNLLRNSLPIVQFLFRNMVRVDHNFIVEFLDKIEKECRFEGIFHKSSMRANLINILDSISFNLEENNKDQPPQFIIDTLFRIAEIDSDLLFQYGMNEYPKSNFSLYKFQRMIAKIPEFTSFSGYDILFSDTDEEVRHCAFKNLMQKSNELEETKGYHFLKKIYENIVKRIHKILKICENKSEDPIFFHDGLEFNDLRLDITFALGGLYITHGEYEKAIKCYEEYQDCTDNNGECLLKIGYIYYLRGEYDKAEQEFQKGKDDIMCFHNKEWLYYLNMGHLSLARGNLTEAELNFQNSYKLNQNKDDLFIIGESLIGLGDTLQKMGKYEEASEKYEEAFKYANQIPNSILRAKILNSTGTMHCNQGHYKKAMEDYSEALEINNRLEIPYNAMMNLQGLGIVSKKMKDYHKADFFLEKVLKICRELNLKIPPV